MRHPLSSSPIINVELENTAPIVEPETQTCDRFLQININIIPASLAAGEYVPQSRLGAVRRKES